MKYREYIAASRPARPDLTNLTPVQANYIVTHFIHNVNKPLAKGLAGIPPRIVGQNLKENPLGFSANFLIHQGRPDREESNLFTCHFRTHYLSGFEGTNLALEELAAAIFHYAAGSTGAATMTAESMAMCETILKSGWDTIDAAKKNSSLHVRNQATELEKAITDYYQKMPGQKFYLTSDSTVAR